VWKSTFHIHPTHGYAPLQLSGLSLPAIPSPCIHHYLVVRMVNHSPRHSLFSKCGNFSSGQVSQLQATQAIRCEKELQSQPNRTASQRMTSSSLGDGKAMLSTSISTSNRNPTTYKDSSCLTHGFSPPPFTNLSGNIDGPMKLPSYPHFISCDRRSGL
jgi:hypothetical protein